MSTVAGGVAGGGVRHQLTDLLDDVQEPSLVSKLVWGEARYASGAVQDGDDHVPPAPTSRMRIIAPGLCRRGGAPGG